MVLYFIYIFISSECFFMVLAGSQNTISVLSEPLIYPRKTEIIVDANTELTLGCKGAEILNWTYKDDVNGYKLNYNVSKIIQMYNNNELEYKYETLLIIHNVSYLNVGYYYCHGKNVNYNTPLRSAKIYIYVEDTYALSVLKNKTYPALLYHWILILPCRPTTPNVNISLTCSKGYATYEIANSFYTSYKLNNIRFNPHIGFTINFPDILFISECHCEFSKNKNTEMKGFKIVHTSLVASVFNNKLNYMDGPSILFEGDKLTLQCGFLKNKFNIQNTNFKWTLNGLPLSGNNIKIKNEIITLKYVKFDITTLTIKNVSAKHEGYYECYHEGFDKSILNKKYVAINSAKSILNRAMIIRHNREASQIYIKMGENITLSCEKGVFVKWEFPNQKSRVHHVEYYELNNKFKAELNLVNVSKADTGYYFCKGFSNFSPIKLEDVYIQVKDNISSEFKFDKRKYKEFSSECYWTTDDIELKVCMRHFDNCLLSKNESVLIPAPILYNDICSSPRTSLLTVSDLPHYELQPFIIGAKEQSVFIGETLEITCTLYVFYNIEDNAISWIVPNNIRKNNIVNKSLRILGAKIFISKILFYNVTKKHEGRYTCYNRYDNTTDMKYISVYDQFNAEPEIKIIGYDYAYIGVPLLLRCYIFVDNNFSFNMAWTVPGMKDLKYVTTKYIPALRNTYGEIILKITNVSHLTEGNYTCHVFDSTYKKKSITKNVKVRTKQEPKILRKNTKEFIISSGETFVINCTADGDPTPDLRIFWRNYSIPNYERLNTSLATIRMYFTAENNSGIYTCFAQNRFGEDKYEFKISVAEEFSIFWYILIFILIIIIINLITLFIYRSKQRKKHLQQGLYLASSFNLTDIGLPVNNVIEIPRNKIQLGCSLGTGFFGHVMQANITNYFESEPNKQVAVKMLHTYSSFNDLDSLISEIKIMAQIGNHVNLINFLGICTDNIKERQIYIILEYCKYGNLRDHIVLNRDNYENLINLFELVQLPSNWGSVCKVLIRQNPAQIVNESYVHICTLDLLFWGFQIARGMVFLAEKKIVHGDLAARNILLADNNIVKISDFGLSRRLCTDEYIKKTQCPLPIKWMALESIRSKIFSAKSDIWSFGIVLWELFSLGQNPYCELEPDMQFYRKLESGYRMEKPKYATKEIYQLMMECWSSQPKCRPSFKNISETIQDLLTQSIGEEHCKYPFVYFHVYENWNA